MMTQDMIKHRKMFKRIYLFFFFQTKFAVNNEAQKSQTSKLSTKTFTEQRITQISTKLFSFAYIMSTAILKYIITGLYCFLAGEDVVV